MLLGGCGQVSCNANGISGHDWAADNVFGNLYNGNNLPDSCSPNGLACNIRWSLSGSGTPLVLVAFEGGAAGAGRVAIAGTWKVFHGRAHNQRLVNQIIDWLAKKP